MAKNEKLFDMFSPTTTQEWMDKITVDLKGADFDKKLVWRTNEGFNVKPFYRREDVEGLGHIGTMPGQFPYVRGTKTNNDWLIRQEINGSSAEEINREARLAIDRGVDSIGIYFAKDITAQELDIILADIDLKKVELNITCCMGSADNIATLVANYIKSKGLENDFRGSIDFNPFKRLLVHGMEFPKDMILEKGMAIYKTVKDIPNFKCFAVDSYMLNNAGAYITQELGYALAWGAEWMTLFTDKGLTPCEVASRIKFNMGISSNYFMEIAKFRAARMLWLR